LPTVINTVLRQQFQTIDDENKKQPVSHSATNKYSQIKSKID